MDVRTPQPAFERPRNNPRAIESPATARILFIEIEGSDLAFRRALKKSIRALRSFAPVATTAALLCAFNLPLAAAGRTTAPKDPRPPVESTRSRSAIGFKNTFLTRTATTHCARCCGNAPRLVARLTNRSRLAPRSSLGTGGVWALPRRAARVREQRAGAGAAGSDGAAVAADFLRS